MKKRLLIILSLVVLTVACSLAVWANEQTPVQPACDKCAKLKAEGKAGADAGCEKCPKMQAEGKPCADKGCDKCAKLKAAEQQPCCDKTKAAEQKPCCDKSKPESKP
jgi:hypothetical protein